MNTRQHAYLARALQDACGGTDLCVSILELTPFAMGRTALYDCRNPATGKTMPAGAIVALESVAKRNIYTQALAQTISAPTDADCAVSEACEASENMARAQSMIRRAGEDNVFTEAEKREIEPILQAVEQSLFNVRAAMEQAK